MLEYEHDEPLGETPFILDPLRLGVNFLGVATALLESRNVSAEEVNEIGQGVVERIIGNRSVNTKVSQEDYLLYLEGVCRWFLAKRGHQIE